MNEIDRQFDEILDSAFSQRIDELLADEESLHLAGLPGGGASAQSGGGIKEYQTVTPQAKMKLKGILKHYAKDPHPFAACVRDNRKRFGDRTEAVCAVLKDIIRNTTKWRGNPGLDKGAPGIAAHVDSSMIPLSEQLMLDEETAQLVERLGEMDLWELMAMVDEETLNASDVSPVTDDHRALLYHLHPHVKPKTGRGPSIGLKKDHKGFFVHTHRARSKSYPTVGSIPRKAVDYIKSTG